MNKIISFEQSRVGLATVGRSRGAGAAGAQAGAAKVALQL